jgi:hypothetical protein
LRAVLPGHLPGYERTLSLEEILAEVSQHPEWQKRSGEPFSDQTNMREIRSILSHYPQHFVSVGNRWRLRSHDACSFCLSEDGYRCKSAYGQCICLDCAETALTALREKKANQDRITQNEAEILDQKFLLGS